MKEIITEKGIIKYRMPNILEAYDLLEKSGVTQGESSSIKLKRNIIEHMESLIDYSEIEDCKSYGDLLLNVDQMLLPLGEIADELITKTFAVFKKKN